METFHSAFKDLEFFSYASLWFLLARTPCRKRGWFVYHISRQFYFFDSLQLFEKWPDPRQPRYGHSSWTNLVLSHNALFIHSLHLLEEYPCILQKTRIKADEFVDNIFFILSCIQCLCSITVLSRALVFISIPLFSDWIYEIELRRKEMSYPLCQ